MIFLDLSSKFTVVLTPEGEKVFKTYAKNHPDLICYKEGTLLIVFLEDLMRIFGGQDVQPASLVKSDQIILG